MKIKIIRMVLSVIFLFLNTAFAVAKEIDNAKIPPGCLDNTAMIGGCFGKSLIYITKKPSLQCLNLEVNNCNGGVITITNNCSSDVKVGNLNIGTKDTTIEAIRKSDGSTTINRTKGNVSLFNPDSYVLFEVLIEVNGKFETLEYHKTRQLCE